MKLTQKLVRQAFDYDPTEPLALRWRTVSKMDRRTKIGDIAGHWHPISAGAPILHRYVSVGGNRRVPVQRVVWLYVTGEPAPHRLWFKDGNHGDCRFENLTTTPPRQSPDKRKEMQKNSTKAWKAQFTNTEWAERLRKRNLRRDYGISVEEYGKMFAEQSGVCAICLKPETATRLGRILPLAVDHCHSSNRVRDLLCVNCNNGLGRFTEDAETLRRAADYLERHHDSISLGAG